MSRRTNLLIIGLAILILVVAVAVVLPQWRSAAPLTAPVTSYPAPMAAGESTATATPPAPTVAPTPAAAADQASPLPAPPTPATLRRYTYRVVNVLPHDPNAFTQGLVYADGIFYEGTGRNGQSWLRKVEPTTGAVLQQHDLHDCSQSRRRQGLEHRRHCRRHRQLARCGA
jgi:hypothetical protein